MGIAGVLGGRLADVYMHQTKSVVLISIAVMALGNVQYAIGINVWNVLCSRLLCGELQFKLERDIHFKYRPLLCICPDKMFF